MEYGCRLAAHSCFAVSAAEAFWPLVPDIVDMSMGFAFLSLRDARRLCEISNVLEEVTAYVLYNTVWDGTYRAVPYRTVT